MKRRTTSEWLTLFAEHEASTLSAVAFCRERGLNTQYFGKRRRQLLENHNINTPSSFVPVTLTRQSTTGSIEFQFGETVNLKIPLLVSPLWLAELIQQLQA